MRWDVLHQSVLGKNMNQIEQIVLPQNGETPMQYSSKGIFSYRYAYARRSDSQQYDEKGEDFLTFQTDGNRFVFALCDGVGSSFMGDWASRFLGERLSRYFAKLDLNLPEVKIKQNVFDWLMSLQPEANSLILSYPLPETDSPLIKLAIEIQREDFGSQSAFVAGVVDIEQNVACFVSAGDLSLELFKDSLSFGSALFPDTMKSVWSSKDGLLGDLYVAKLQLNEFNSLAVYSRGFEYAITVPAVIGSNHNYRSSVIDALSNRISKANWDIDTSFLEIWFDSPALKFPKKEYEPKILAPELIRVYDQPTGSCLIHWSTDAPASQYEIKFLASDMNTLISFYCKDSSWQGQVPDSRTRFVSIRAWQNNRPGEWSDFVEIKQPEETRTASAPPPRYPPPVAAPPPRPLAAPLFRLIGVSALAALIIVFASLIVYLFSSPLSASRIVPTSSPSPIWGQIATVAKGIFVASILSLIPTLAAKFVDIDSRVKLSIVEIFLFAIATIGIGYELFQLKGNNWWILFAVLIVAFLDIGAHLIDSIREATFRRIDRTWQYKSLRKDAASFDELYKYERILYIALPLGIMLGVLFGVFQKATEIEIALFCVRAITLAAFLILILITFKSFKLMIVPMYQLSNSPNQKLVFTSKQREDAKIKEEKMISLAIMSTDLRKLYLYDSTHNILLMFLFGYSFLITYGATIELKYLILAILLATLAFSQFPYVYGQNLLHEKALEPFEGLPRAEVDEKIKKYAPLYPTSHFLAALLTNGTAGGLVFFLLDYFVKGLIK